MAPELPGYQLERDAVLLGMAKVADEDTSKEHPGCAESDAAVLEAAEHHTDYANEGEHAKEAFRTADLDAREELIAFLEAL